LKLRFGFRVRGRDRVIVRGGARVRVGVRVSVRVRVRLQRAHLRRPVAADQKRLALRSLRARL